MIDKNIYKSISIARKNREYQKSINLLLSIKDEASDDNELFMIYSWLSEDYAESNDFNNAEFYGKKSIELRHQYHVSKGEVKVISFSLYGTNPVYCETMIVNAEMAKSIYPEWTVRIYHDETVPTHVIKRLNALSAKTIDINGLNIAKMPGTFWRFLALQDNNVDVVIFRDADSLLSEREKYLVDDWLLSDKPFHVIRDWYSHTDLILAGLWGARSGLLPNIYELILSYINNNKIHPTHADQMFLAEVIWPKIYRYCKHHSSVFKNILNSSWPDNLPIIINKNKDCVQLGSWLTSRYDINGPKGDYAVIILDENNKQMCDYIIQEYNYFELPRAYRYKIEKNEFKLLIIPMNKLTSDCGSSSTVFD